MGPAIFWRTGSTRLDSTLPIFAAWWKTISRKQPRLSRNTVGCYKAKSVLSNIDCPISREWGNENETCMPKWEALSRQLFPQRDGYVGSGFHASALYTQRSASKFPIKNKGPVLNHTLPWATKIPLARAQWSTRIFHSCNISCHCADQFMPGRDPTMRQIKFWN